VPIFKRIRRHERREERREEPSQSSNPRKKILEGEGPLQNFMKNRKKPLQEILKKRESRKR